MHRLLLRIIWLVGHLEKLSGDTHLDEIVVHLVQQVEEVGGPRSNDRFIRFSFAFIRSPGLCSSFVPCASPTFPKLLICHKLEPLFTQSTGPSQAFPDSLWETWESWILLSPRNHDLQ